LALLPQARRWFGEATVQSVPWTVDALLAAKRGRTVSVVLPALNEEATVGAVVSELRPLLGGLIDELVVMDSGSTDRTVAVARAAGARVVHRTDDGGLDKLVVFVPVPDAPRVREAMTRAGAGAIGAYDSCTFSSSGEGRFRPLPGATPAVGAVGDLEVVEEHRVEAVLPRSLRRQVVEAVRSAHPYEEPAFDLIELADPGPPRTGTAPAATRGHGRVGDLPRPTTLRELATQVAAALPAAAHGVRVAGDPDRPVRTVAVGAGSGDSLLEEVRRTGADAYVTSDLKHHRASEYLEEGGPALLDVAHWAAEWLWLPLVAEKVTRAVAATGDTVVTRVSALVTDPWSFRA